jgi:hypothetical protein
MVAAGCAQPVATTPSPGFPLPDAPAYPSWGPFGSRQAVIDKAQALSNGVEQYVKDYLDGKVPATIPNSLLPDARGAKLGWKVRTESEIDVNNQWMVRPAHEVDWSGEQGLYPDPNVTYLWTPAALVPFGSTAIITGQFPHARFFSMKATPSFQPEQYHYDGLAVGEVPMVDADINPDPGSVNPFRVGANRNAPNRNYTIRFESKIANSAEIDPAYTFPFRSNSPTNTRTMGGIHFQGPFGNPDQVNFSPLVTKSGNFATGELWGRYYAPDNSPGPNGDPLAGVPLPKITYQLPDGRKYFIEADLAEFRAKINQRQAVAVTTATAPTGIASAGEGWQKLWGVSRFGYENIQRQLFGTVDHNYTRAVDKVLSGRGEDLPAPQNYESSSSLCTYCVYLIRPMNREPGKVVTITGTLPRTPKTRNGEPTMTDGQLRYWSITGYDGTNPLEAGSQPYGKPTFSLMDDEIVTDAQGHYTIVLSSAADRPANATAANGVTWADWGPTGEISLYNRWMSVGPEWTFAKAPTEDHLGRESDHASSSYDRSRIGNNDRTGFLGDYHPVIGYLSTAQFAALGTNVKWNQIPAWK